ncbi:SDR family NAD(P)-dependent oxidoreductase [Micromonospora sp. WMMC241]|uniref:SDR family NAD(P)-dependent oxidoreductase n=1 Tax=Micromonospora sp. WMMC241 TaxID=3015159 RepID=UPI0022B60CE3|nr:SDR family NAD(P)-dependent oxidoreductase [Micromonospora sp. WMMC241]MCZ7437435.1 SDR family NAD(P)-dependent oxidoreductase [Micromonospora sp. WMMC241]
MRDLDFPGGTAVVTGAAGGIGAALADGLARRGCDLVLLDRDADGLAAVVESIRARHLPREIDTYVVDLADADATDRVAAEIHRAHPRIRLLINNAGVALGGRFDQVTLDEFLWVVEINFRAVVRLTHALLPALKAEPGAHLVNVSSLFGLIAPAGQAAYSASKFAVRGFTEALRHELVDDGIGVTSVHPGGIRTRIAASARVGSGVPVEEYEAGRRQFEKLLTIDPAVAAEAILNGARRRRGRVLIGWSATLPDLLARIAPAGYGRVLALGMRSRPARVPAPRAASAEPAPRAASAESAPPAEPAGPDGSGPAVGVPGEPGPGVGARSGGEAVAPEPGRPA